MLTPYTLPLNGTSEPRARGEVPTHRNIRVLNIASSLHGRCISFKALPK